MTSNSIFIILLIVLITKSAVTISYQELRAIEDQPYDYSETFISPVDATNPDETSDDNISWDLQQLINGLRHIRRHPPIKKRNDLQCLLSPGGGTTCHTKAIQNIGHIKSVNSPGRRKKRDLRLFRI